MLPFLKKKQVAGLIIAKHRHPSGNIDESPEKAAHGYSGGLEACARDILAAIDSKSAGQLAQALKDAFEVLEAEPHVEGEHIEESEE